MILRRLLARMFQNAPDWAGTPRKEIAHSEGRRMERRNYCSFSIGYMVSKVAFEANEFHESLVLYHHVWDGRGPKLVCPAILLSVPP